MKLLHFHTPSTPASMPPARERNRVFDAPDSAANAASTRSDLPFSEWAIISSGGSENNRVFAGMVLVAIAPRPLFSRAAILKYGFGGSGAVGVTAIGGGEVIVAFGRWASGRWDDYFPSRFFILSFPGFCRL